MPNVFHGTIALIAPIKVMGNLEHGMRERYDLLTGSGDNYFYLLQDVHTVNIAFVPLYIPNLKPAWFRNVLPESKNLTCFW